ncbi:MAG TPA: flagellar basal body rod protein FlgB [Symbiobacteriaceae bacterium]|nr:flagellar basal body rod protein FlgB [Symbiobacteriaceae bacterium]
MPVFGKTVGYLEQAMAAANLRHQVIADNIANVNVPKFQAHEVLFEEQLRAAMADSTSKPGELSGIVAHPLHIPFNTQTTAATARVQPQVVQSDGVYRQDGNTVDIESEQAKLAANQLWYQALVRSVNDEFTRLRTAILDGRR